MSSEEDDNPATAPDRLTLLRGRGLGGFLAGGEASVVANGAEAGGTRNEGAMVVGGWVVTATCGAFGLMLPGGGGGEADVVGGGGASVVGRGGIKLREGVWDVAGPGGAEALST